MKMMITALSTLMLYSDDTSSSALCLGVLKVIRFHAVRTRAGLWYAGYSSLSVSLGFPKHTLNDSATWGRPESAEVGRTLGKYEMRTWNRDFPLEMAGFACRR